MSAATLTFQSPRAWGGTHCVQRLVRPIPRFWMKTTTTDRRTYLAGFDGESTASVETVVLGPDGKVESRWPN